jgi:nascent polypeptide-associated complex subunit beta
MSELTPEIIEARKKFNEQYGNIKIGGKGTQKKKKIVTHKSSAVADKKIIAIQKKAGTRNLSDTTEINIFKDDNSVIHFKKPKVEYSIKEKCTFVTGTPDLNKSNYFII